MIPWYHILGTIFSSIHLTHSACRLVCSASTLMISLATLPIPTALPLRVCLSVFTVSAIVMGRLSLFVAYWTCCIFWAISPSRSRGFCRSIVSYSASHWFDSCLRWVMNYGSTAAMAPAVPYSDWKSCFCLANTVSASSTIVSLSLITLLGRVVSSAPSPNFHISHQNSLARYVPAVEQCVSAVHVLWL